MAQKYFVMTLFFPTEESSKSLNATREQYNTMDGFIEHEEHTQGQHGEENDNTDTARGVQVENAQVSFPSLSIHLYVTSWPIHLHVVPIVILDSIFSFNV